MNDEKTDAERWEDLQPDVRAAIVEQAKDRLWWNEFSARLKALGPWASWITVVLAAAWLMWDQIIHFAAWIANSSPNNTTP